MILHHACRTPHSWNTPLTTPSLNTFVYMADLTKIRIRDSSYHCPSRELNPYLTWSSYSRQAMMSSIDRPSQTPTPRSHLLQDEACQNLLGLGLVLSKSDDALICSHCLYALKPFGQTVSKHPWEKHSVPAKERSGLNALVLKLKLPDPNTLPTSQDWSPAHPYLALQAGVVCLQCNYRTTSKDLLQRHLSKEHGQRRSDEDLGRGKIWTEVSLQSWSQNGKRKFWIVEPTIDQDTAQSLDQSPRRQRRLAQIHRAEEERVASRDHNTSTILEDPILSSNWMRRTGWVNMFSNTNRLILLRLAQLPAANGEGLFLGECDGVQIKSKREDERTIQ
jgi:hypothetical protein